jgi:hypothetical protein
LRFAFVVGAFLACTASAATFTNGGFESGMGGWRFWTRAPQMGSAQIDLAEFHAGKVSARLEHKGEKDWSFEPLGKVRVQGDDLMEFSAWGKLPGEGRASLCVSTWDKEGKVGEWSLGERQLATGPGWQQARARFVVPTNIVEIQPRLIGYGPASLWVDDFDLVKVSNLAALRADYLPAEVVVSNAVIVVRANTVDGTLTVEDRRTRRVWRQQALRRDFIVREATGGRGSIQLGLMNPVSGMELKASVKLAANLPEFSFEVAASGELKGALAYPHPFTSEAGEYLVVPMNEGISYPVEDKTVETFRLVAYGGHGICMGFWGATDGGKGHLAIIESPDDASIRMSRVDGRLVISPEWDPQRGQFGYTRKLRYVFFDQGGHVAIAKRYRAYAKEIGLFKTLAEKRQANPNVDLLIGAVNVWCWDRNSVPIVKDLQAAGIERILWSNQQSPENIRALNELPGVLSSRYDIYQDAMNPANFPRLRYIHRDWTTNAWPNDINVSRSGQHLKGWEVETKDGAMIPCGVICDKRALDYARERIPAELVKSPYRCRFIDTTTAAPWYECYSTNHPMTRTESKQWKMKLLRYVSEDNRLVTGCETGHEASVPYLHYFEGMLSLGPYRVPDAGRDMARIWTNAPERVVKYQLGHAFRLPLWELVYHDCVVAQWYWGDYNNKLPALWDKRDQFNALYGTPPMFMFDRKSWEANKARFVQSYTNTCPLARAVGYQEMTDHRFLTPDRAVQQTRFANGVTVTVNFGDAVYAQAGKAPLAAGGIMVEGKP